MLFVGVCFNRKEQQTIFGRCVYNLLIRKGDGHIWLDSFDAHRWLFSAHLFRLLILTSDMQQELKVVEEQIHVVTSSRSYGHLSVTNIKPKIETSPFWGDRVKVCLVDVAFCTFWSWYGQSNTILTWQSGDKHCVFHSVGKSIFQAAD